MRATPSRRRASACALHCQAARFGSCSPAHSLGDLQPDRLVQITRMCALAAAYASSGKILSIGEPEATALTARARIVNATTTPIVLPAATATWTLSAPTAPNAVSGRSTLHDGPARTLVLKVARQRSRPLSTVAATNPPGTLLDPSVRRQTPVATTYTATGCKSAAPVCSATPTRRRRRIPPRCARQNVGARRFPANTTATVPVASSATPPVRAASAHLATTPECHCTTPLARTFAR